VSEPLPSQFLTPLEVRELEDTSADGRGTWQLLAPLVYQSEMAGRTFTVPAGFVTDYASVPRVPLVFLLFGDCGHPAAVLHDHRYSMHDVTRETADLLFHEALLATDVPTWRAALMYAAVREFGLSHWEAANTPQPTPTPQEPAA
jgi:hypothetical protein